MTKTEILKVSAYQNFGLFCRFLPLWDPREEAEGGSLQGWGGAEEKDNPGQCEQEAVGRSPGAYIGGGTGRWLLCNQFLLCYQLLSSYKFDKKQLLYKDGDFWFVALFISKKVT